MRTVLLGLGGTGSKIVNNVVRILNEHDVSVGTPEVVCAVLDTNDNDRKGISETNVGTPVIATSRDRKIADYIKTYNQRGVKDWFPLESNLLTHDMKDGASQLRVKSRLAFYDMMNTASMIRELKRQLDRVFTRRMGEKVRVMVVSSVSGGTGSGMFIQLGLWLRKFFEDKRCSVSIRGIFLLPDVFVGTLKDMEDDNFEAGRNYANGYAAIRELNAITKIRTKGLIPAHPIKIDGLFDSDTDRNCGTPVYDYAFFVDKDTAVGEPIDDIDEFNRVAADLIYAQLYNPMRDNMYSEEDNLYDKFKTAKDPVYASCGVAVAKYPFKDILEYCELAALNDSLTSSWIRLDKEIKKEKEDQEKDRLKGSQTTRVIEDRVEFVYRFEEELKRAFGESGSDPFFLNLYSHVNKMEKDYAQNGRDVINKPVNKLESFVEGIEESIAEKVKSKNFGKMNSYRLPDDWNKDNSDDVEGLKTLYKGKKDAVNGIIHDIDVLSPIAAKELLREIMPDDMVKVQFNDEKSVMGLLTRVDKEEVRHFIHPVAARYLLYRLSAKIEALKNDIAPDKLKGYAKAGAGGKYPPVIYDNEYTRGKETTPEQYLDSEGFFQNKKKFLQDYRDKYYTDNHNRYSLCRDYAIARVKHYLFTELIKKLSVLINNFEEFFRGLEDCQKKLEDELEANIKRNSKPDKKVRFICASKSDKEKMYKALNLHSSDDNPDINKIVVETMYGKFCAAENPEAEKNRPYVEEGDENLFVEKAKEVYGNLLTTGENKKYIDVDIYTALCRQSDFALEAKNPGKKLSEKAIERGVRYENNLASLVAELRDIATPFLDADEDFPEDISDEVNINAAEYDASEFVDENFKPIQKAKTWWGYNSVVLEKCENLGSILGVSGEKNASPNHNKYELTCYRGVYGIQAERVPKFNETNSGAYYKEYTALINKMVNNILNADPELEGVEEKELASTPHLDKTWHLYLPYISQEKRDEAEKEFYRSFWLAVAYGIVTLNKDEDYQIKRTKMVSGVSFADYEVITYQGRVVGKSNVVELLKALREDGTFMMQTRGLEKKFKKERTQKRSYTTYHDTELMGGVAVDIDDTNGVNKQLKVGGLETKGEMNALNLIIRYCNDNLSNTVVAAHLVSALEGIFTDLVKGNYRKGETAKISQAMYDRCYEVYKNCTMKSDANQFVKEWKKAWSANKKAKKADSTTANGSGSDADNK